MASNKASDVLLISPKKHFAANAFILLHTTSYDTSLGSFPEPYLFILASPQESYMDGGPESTMH